MTKAKPGSQRSLFKKGLRRCITCDEIKSLSDFYRRSNGWYISQCKPCIRNHVNKTYEQNPEPKKAYQRIFYQNNKDYYTEYNKQRISYNKFNKASRKHPLDSKCACCGATENLERHHEQYKDPAIFKTLCSKCHGYVSRRDEHEEMERNLHVVRIRYGKIT